MNCTEARKLARDRLIVLDEAKVQLAKCQPVHATSRNTPSVKSGHEMGGYVKYYIMDAVAYRKMYHLLRGDA